jgi:hypothetical protein
MPTAIPLPSPTEQLLSVWLVLSIVAALLVMVGWRTAPAAAILAGLNAVALAWDAQVYSNHTWLLTLLCAYLAFARSDSTYSLAARKVSGPRASVPWWPQLLMMTQVSICYLFAGLSKLNSFWFDGEYLASWLRIDLPGIVVFLAPAAVVLTELLLAAALWFKRTRLLGALVGFSLHAGIVALIDHSAMVFIAFGLLCLAVYPLFLNRPTWAVIRACQVSHAPTAPVTSPSPADL